MSELRSGTENGTATLDRESLVFQDGETVFARGDAGDVAYVVQHGAVVIVRDPGTEQETVLRTVGPGELFGEIELITSAPRLADAIAKSKTRLIAITAADFQEQMTAATPLLRYCIRHMADRITALSPPVKAGP